MSGSAPGAEQGRSARRRIWRSPFFWAALFGVITIPLLRPLLRRVPEPPPVIATLAPFELRDQSGRSFGSADLRGKVWVANFFFTSCPSICPGLTRSMRALQQRYKQQSIDVQLVSFSVDPENDTPERLTAYAMQYGADLSSWTFLTGSAAQIRAVVVDGFRTHLGEPARDRDNLIDIAHAPYFVLVDEKLGIRGYYKPDESGLDEVYHRSQHVLAAQGKR